MKLEFGQYVRTKIGTIDMFITKHESFTSFVTGCKGNILYLFDRRGDIISPEKFVVEADCDVKKLLHVGDIITYEFPTALGMEKYENVTITDHLLNELQNGENNREYHILSVLTKEESERGVSSAYLID